MSPAIALTIGLLLAAVAAAAASLYLWRIRRPRASVREGLRILSGMRWRELSNLIIDALAGSGFEREPAEARAERGSLGEVVVYREGRPWLLDFRQGLASTVTRDVAEEFLRKVRVQQAAGGVLVALGRVEPEARQVAANVELVDGPELWKLVEPCVPASVAAEVDARARASTLRANAIVLALSTAAGLALAWVLASGAPPAPPAEPAPPAPEPAAPVSSPSAAAAGAPPAAQEPVAPRSEEEQRVEIAQQITALPGVARAAWSTRSTLQIFIDDGSLATDEALCSVMRTNELLRASRLQLESPPGSGLPVRFMQCASY